MRKRWMILTNVVAFMMLVLFFGQTAFCCKDTWEHGCDDKCFEHEGQWVLNDGEGGVNCFCISGTRWEKCKIDYLGVCKEVYVCSEADCEGACVYNNTMDKYRCLVD